MSNIELALVLTIPHKLHLTVWPICFCGRDYEAEQLPHSTNLLFLNYYGFYFCAGMVPRYVLSHSIFLNPYFYERKYRKTNHKRVVWWSGQITEPDLNGTSTLGHVMLYRSLQFRHCYFVPEGKWSLLICLISLCSVNTCNPTRSGRFFFLHWHYNFKGRLKLSANDLHFLHHHETQ